MTTGQAAEQRPITRKQLLKSALGDVAPPAPEPGELLDGVLRGQELAAELQRERLDVEIERLRLVAPAEHPRVVQDEPGCEPNVTIPHPLLGHGVILSHARPGAEGSRPGQACEPRSPRSDVSMSMDARSSCRNRTTARAPCLPQIRPNPEAKENAFCAKKSLTTPVRAVSLRT